MFTNQRYLTCGIEAEIPMEAIAAMWIAIELMPEPKDRYQFFDLAPLGGCVQRITHNQEQPEYTCEVYAPLLLPDAVPVTAKVYVIDDGDHSTMLLADEY
ncbi:MAG: DUF960 domain-containing protein [Oscillospiraceae bacterium]|nr:DUF960 domain-containing protein [Oscillospiraceae bacterium]